MVDLVARWEKIAKRDDCLDQMLPSDIRALVAEIKELRLIIATEEWEQRGQHRRDEPRPY